MNEWLKRKKEGKKENQIKIKNEKKDGKKE